MLDTHVENARQKMVDEQLIPRGIRDPLVLKAMRDVPRHCFVKSGDGSMAYSDRPLPIGNGQTISQPYIVALMTESLGLTGGERVLEIGTGSGYQAAILAELAADVYTVEKDPTLLESALETIRSLGYTNVHGTVGDGTAGWPEASPYAAILVTAGAPDIPEPLKAQLAPGGRLVIPVGDRNIQELVRIIKGDGELRHENLCGCRFVPLRGAHGW